MVSEEAKDLVLDAYGKMLADRLTDMLADLPDDSQWCWWASPRYEAERGTRNRGRSVDSPSV